MDESCVAGVCECATEEITCNGVCANPGQSKECCGASGDCAGANDGEVCGDGEECIDGTCAKSLGCSNLAAAVEGFDGTPVTGCAGVVTYPEPDSLCAEGYSPCTAAEWRMERGAGIPTHHYWLETKLRWDPEGSSGSWVSDTDGSDCGKDTPNEYFGGCDGNFTAGTLCCAD